MNRTRTSTVIPSITVDNATTLFPATLTGTITESLGINLGAGKLSNVSHTKYGLSSGLAAVIPGYYTNSFDAAGRQIKVWVPARTVSCVNMYLVSISAVPVGVLSAFRSTFERSIKHKNLPTSSQLNTLAFIKEIGDSIAIFTKKFWRSLSYGKLEWGVKPFISDIKNILENMVRATSSATPIFRDGAKMTKRYPNVGFSIGALSVTVIGSLDVTLKQARTGRILYEAGTEAQQWLDRLGIYADLNTAWEVVPLSFMVDWLIPVGDFLARWSPSGNIRDVHFAGCLSYKEELSWVQHSAKANGVDLTTGNLSGSLVSYNRRLQNEILSLAGPINVDTLYNSETYHNLSSLFGLLYLLVTNKTRLPEDLRLLMRGGSGYQLKPKLK